MTFDWVEWFNGVLCEMQAMSPNARQKAAVKKYKQTDKGKAANKKYNQTDKHKAAMRKYNQTDKGRAVVKKYRQTDKGKTALRRGSAKRKRQLGYNELFEITEGYISHHLDDTVVVPIPIQVHQQLSGHSREKHRALVLDWLHDNDPDLWIDCMVYLHNL